MPPFFSCAEIIFEKRNLAIDKIKKGACVINNFVYWHFHYSLWIKFDKQICVGNKLQVLSNILSESPKYFAYFIDLFSYSIESKI